MTSQTLTPLIDLTPPPLARVRPDASQQAVLALVAEGGPVSVFGAPGTGKTLVAELAAVEALRAGSSALVVSVERHAAQALSGRIVRRAGLALPRRVAVTPSALAMSILRARADAVAAQPWAGAAEAARAFQPQMVTGAEQLAAFAELLAMDAAGELGLVWPKGVPVGARQLPAFRAELRALLTRAAERGLDPVDLAQLGSRWDRPDWVAAAQFYQRYLDTLDMPRAGDTGLKLDAAAMVATAFARLRDWCEPFQAAGRTVRLDPATRPAWDLVIVDDYQEASLALHRLVGQLGAQGSQLLVLGSPQSAAQGYRGALPGLLAQTLRPAAAPAAAGGGLPELGQGLAWAAADGSPLDRLGLAGAPGGGWGARAAVIGSGWRQGGDLARCAQSVRQQVRSPGAPRAALAAPSAPPAGGGPGLPGLKADQAGGAAAAGRDGLVAAWTARSGSEAAALVARRLRQARLAEGLAWDEMAVLTRTAGQVALLRSLLTGAGVPVGVPGSEVLATDQRAVAPLVKALHVASQPGRLTAVVAAELLTSAIGGLDAADLRVLRRHLLSAAPPGGLSEAAAGAPSGAPPGLPLAARAGLPPGGLPEAGAGKPAGRLTDGSASDRLLVAVLGGATETEAPPGGWLAAAAAGGLPERIVKRVETLAAALAAGRSQAATASAAAVLWAIWQATGLAAKWRELALGGGARGVQADADLDAVLALFAAANRHDARRAGSGAGQFAAFLEAQEVPSDTIAAHSPAGGKVHLSTATAAVGREWDLVVLVGLEEDVWPDPRLRDTLLGAGQLADLVDGTAAPADPVERRRAVLEDEGRLLTLAVTRARRELLAVAVDNEEEQPSRFFDWLAQHAAGRPAVPQAAAAGTGCGPDGRPLPFDLRGVVAAARSALVAAPASQPAPAAAAVLAVLAGLGAAGAAPGAWPGLAPRSTDQPLLADSGLDALPVLSPSQLERLSQCPLSWALQRVGGSVAAGPEASLGTLVHSLAEEFGTLEALQQAPSLEALAARLEARLAERWGELSFEGDYTARGFEHRARQMIGNLAAYLDSRRDLAEVAVEARIDPQLAGPAGLPVRLSGVIDRIETDRAGNVEVVDFKTGKTPPSLASVRTNPQLGAYQLALEAGLVAGRGPVAVAGARLHYLAAGDKGRPAELAQPPLRAGQSWLQDLLRQCAREAAGPRFEARPGDHCRNCPVATSCPAVVEGKQVTA
ncbi:MAG: PD-(D/E)XK nuclease family protein [Bifidobacteriaceae bacterium]|jgi:superfamily I DNA/RNA helicase/RecB family exonuclease|nr:PD-(D/E)XK nuclease family protein [Bifidobacteriaceae bacterium]